MSYLKRHLIPFLVAILVFLGFFIYELKSLSDISEITIPQAQIIVIQGEVSIKPLGQSDWQMAEDGMEVSEHDLIKTEENAQAELYFFNKAVVRLDENTEIELAQLYLDEANPLLTNITLAFNYGHFWTKLFNTSEPDSTLTVTAMDSSATVNGTAIDFSLLNEPGLTPQLTIHVDEGLVTMQHAKQDQLIPVYAQETMVALLESDSDTELELNSFSTTTTPDILDRSLNTQYVKIKPLHENNSQSNWFKHNKELDNEFRDKITKEHHEQIKTIAKTLPDSSFYGFKKFAEGLRLKLNSNPDKKNKFKQAYTNRRFYEAQALVLKGKRALGEKYFSQALNNFRKQNPDDTQILEQQVLLQTALPNSDLYNFKNDLREFYTFAPEDETEKINRIRKLQTIKLKELKELLLTGTPKDISQTLSALENEAIIKPEDLTSILKQLPLNNELRVKDIEAIPSIKPEYVKSVLTQRELLQQNYLLQSQNLHIETENDGTKIINFSDGSIKEIDPDGVISFALPEQESQTFTTEQALTSFIKDQKPQGNISSRTQIKSDHEPKLETQPEEKTSPTIETKPQPKTPTSPDLFTEDGKQILIQKLLLELDLTPGFNDYLLQSQISRSDIQDTLNNLNSESELIKYQESILNEVKNLKQDPVDIATEKNTLISDITNDYNTMPAVQKEVDNQYNSLESLTDHLKTLDSLTEIQTIVDNVRQTAIINDAKQDRLNSLLADINTDTNFQDYLANRDITTEIITRAIENFNDINAVDNFINKLKTDYQNSL